MSTELTWHKAIEKVLINSSEPLHANEITEQIISGNLRTSLGATPARTVAAQITKSIKDKGDKSQYIRVGKGLFTLRSLISSPTNDSKTTSPSKIDIDIEEDNEIISSFGL